MKRALARAIVVVCAFGFASSVPATTATVNYNDMWWNPAESGWGVNIAQQGTTLFLTFFVYDTNTKPTWVTGQLTKTGQSASGQPRFTGDIYVTSGPYYGTTPFDPLAVTIRKAGSVSFSPADAASAALSYSVDGVNVTKSIVRQTLANDDLSGNYEGALKVSYDCPPNPVAAATVFQTSGTITQSGTQFQYRTTDDTGIVCTWAGTWSQQGLLGQVSGTLNCTNGSHGTFTWSEIASSPVAVSGRLTASGVINLPPATNCTVTGTFGLLR